MERNLKLKIGVMGSASGPIMANKKYQKKAYEVGKAIANNNCFLVNGACPGLPDYAARGTKDNGGSCIGISPAFSQEEHIKVYGSPTENHDIIIYTGFGLMERDILNIRTSSGIIILGGGVGTLNEFTIAYDEGVPLAILQDCGGITDHIPAILKICKRTVTPNMIFDKDPEMLVRRLVDLMVKNPRPEHEDERVIKAKKNKAVTVHR